MISDTVGYLFISWVEGIIKAICAPEKYKMQEEFVQVLRAIVHSFIS